MQTTIYKKEQGVLMISRCTIFEEVINKSAMRSANTTPGADCGADHDRLVAKRQIKLRKVKK